MARPSPDRRRRAQPRRARAGRSRGPGAADPRREPVRRRARAGRRARPRRAGPDHVHERHRGRAQGGRARPALPARPAPAGARLAGAGARRAGVVHGRQRLVEVGPQRLHGPLAGGRRGAAARRPLRPPRAARAARARARERALHGAHRVPRDRQAGHPPGGGGPARDGRRRRGPEPGGAAGLGGGHRPADPRRLRPDRDRPADGQPCPAERARPGSMGRALPGVAARDRGRRAGAGALQRADLLPRLPRRAGAPESARRTGAGRAGACSERRRGRPAGTPATASAATRTAGCTSRAAPTT